MRHVQLSVAFNREHEKKYIADIQQAPAWKILRGKLYHFYDMHFNRWHRITGWIAEKLRSPDFDEDALTAGWRDRDLPWQMRQDLRCFRFNHHESVVRTEITEEQYRALGGRM